MTATTFYLPFLPAIDANGLTVSGAQLYFYATGTTTPQAVYSDSGLTVPLSNPVVANAAGVWPTIYLNDALIYRVVLKDGDGATLNDSDPYFPASTGPKGDPGGNAMAVGLATDISGLSIAAGTDLIHTTGYSTAGIGAAFYIADATANAALAAAHPRLCKATSNGRYFRLLPDAGGLVAVDAGGAVAFANEADIDFTQNAQPAMQAAIDYATAIGAAGIKLGDGHYSVWCPQRTAVSDNLDIGGGLTGHPLNITRKTVIEAGGRGTKLWRRTYQGRDPAVYANTQILPQNAINNGATMPWRGGFFFLVGQNSLPAHRDQMAGLILRGQLTVWGGLTRSATPGLYTGGSPTYYVLNGDGSGWDITDKPVWAHNDKYTGDIVFEGDIDIGGFRGELIYQGGVIAGSIYQTGTLTLHDSDGDGFNPAPGQRDGSSYGTLQMERVHIRDVYQALEGASGWDSYINDLRVEDCNRGGGIGGGSFMVAWPNTKSIPVLAIDSLYVARSGNFVAWSGVHIAKATLLDTDLFMGNANSIGAYEVNIDAVTVIVDRIGIDDAVTFFGTSAAGSKGTYNCRIGHLHLDKTAYAIANSLRVGNPIGWFNSLGDRCVVERVTGQSFLTPFSRNPGGVTDYHVGVFDMTGLDYGFNAAVYQDVDTTPTLVFSAAHMQLSLAGAGTYTEYTLPDMSGKLPKGATLTLYTEANLAAATTRVRSTDRLIHTANTKRRFRFDGSNWEPLDPPQHLNATATYDPPSIASGAQATTTVTVNGARAGDYVTVAFTNALTGLRLSGEVTANDTVTVTFDNNTAGAIDLASGTLSVRVGK